MPLPLPPRAAALALAAVLTAPAAVQPAAAQTVQTEPLQTQPPQALQVVPAEADRQVQALMYHRLMAEVLRSGIREQIAAGGSGAADVNPYPSVTAGKALAVCVNWRQTTLDRVSWGGFAYRYGGTVTPEEKQNLAARTLADCRSAYAGRDCACQLLDVDGQSVLEVPAGFLAEYARF